jgi:hypothetical protein
VFFGLWTGLVFIIVGALQCVTLIGIPSGIAGIKLGVHCFFPFGMEFVDEASRQKGTTVININGGYAPAIAQPIYAPVGGQQMYAPVQQMPGYPQQMMNPPISVTISSP